MSRDSENCERKWPRLRAELLQASFHYSTGARRIASLRFEIEGCERDQDYVVFVVIDSETDHIPKTAARSLCTQSWLEKCDAELRDIGVFYERQIKDACNNLIARFSAEV